MTKLEQLIEELCPNGVEYHELGKIAEMRRGTSITKKNVCEGEIPVISGGREPAYYCDTSTGRVRQSPLRGAARERVTSSIGTDRYLFVMRFPSRETNGSLRSIYITF